MQQWGAHGDVEKRGSVRIGGNRRDRLIRIGDGDVKDGVEDGVDRIVGVIF